MEFFLHPSLLTHASMYISIKEAFLGAIFVVDFEQDFSHVNIVVLKSKFPSSQEVLLISLRDSLTIRSTNGRDR